jgi:hypothetical protein
MSDEEINQMMQEMAQMMPDLFGDLPPEMLNTPLAQPETLSPLIPEQEALVKKDLSPKEASALALIDNVTRLTNSFLVKVNSAPELIGSIDRWGKNDSIKNWKSGTTGRDFIEQIELLVQKLTQLKNEDPKTKSYRHLSAFAESKEAYTILTDLEKVLAAEEPSIEITSFSMQKLAKEIKQSIK